MAEASLTYPCSISVCPPESSTNFDDILKNGMPSRFVVEFGSDHPEIIVVPGQSIKIDQIIGYINGMPVRSKINGKVIEVDEKYFIGEYDLDIHSALINTGFGFDLTDDELNKILSA